MPIVDFSECGHCLSYSAESFQYFEEACSGIMQALSKGLHQRRSQFLGAFDGCKVATAQTAITRTQDGQPLLYFLPVYGLVLQICAANDVKLSNLRTALEALAQLVRSDCSGRQLLEDNFYFDLVSSLRRLINQVPLDLLEPILSVIENICSDFCLHMTGEINSRYVLSSRLWDLRSERLAAHCLWRILKCCLFFR